MFTSVKHMRTWAGIFEISIERIIPVLDGHTAVTWKFTL